MFYTPYDPARDGTADTFDDARCAGLIRAATGVDDLDVTLVPQLADGTKVLGYEVAACVADRFRVGRVFLAGDSAHAVPPAGAFGAGLCFQDAHNLAWKLAAVHSGQAGPGLLDSYERERRPAALFTLGQALAQTRVFNDTAPVPGEAEPVEYDTVVFGYRYHSAAVVSDGSGETVPARELSGQPGTRAPHVPLPDGGSTLDHYGRGLVLLTGPEATGFTRAGRGLPAVPLDVDAAEAHGITATGALLVRPDGIVAWRSPTAVSDPEAVLTAVLDRILQPTYQLTGGR